LDERQKRVEAFHVLPLTPVNRERFLAEWHAAQTLFVDDPRAAVINADHLVVAVMTERGYPMGNFEQRAADISVDHPHVVENYRRARGIALRNEQQGGASTEELRKAMVCYRSLFDELLESPAADRIPVHQ
jgi:hypothetical protein